MNMNYIPSKKPGDNGYIRDNSNGDIIGSDYILWSGDRKDEPVEVYVTAVSKNALSNSNTFGGATFGSGAGVKWIND